MILVTGASGVLGSALTCKLVAEGERVCGLILEDDPAPRLASVRGAFTRRDGDVTRAPTLNAALDGVTTVFHTAAIVPFSNALRKKMHAVNSLGTKAMLDAAVARGVTDFVHVSSVSTFGFPDALESLDETASRWNGPSGYAYVDSKREAEIHAEAASDRIRTIIINPGAIFAGDGVDPFSWAYLVRLVATRRLRFNLPGGICAVGQRDVVDGALAAWRHGVSGRKYILATANLMYVDLFAEVARQAGIPCPRLMAPSTGLHAIAAVNAVRNWVSRDPLRAGALNWDNAGLLTKRLYYESARARREIGFDPGSVETLVADVLAVMGLPVRPRA